jgi:alanine racemase
MRNIAVIDLRVLKNNAENIKSKLPNGVKFCGVVKADGYGHGGVEIANALYGVVDSFAVALVEEGVALRQAGIDKEILTLIPVKGKGLKIAVRYSLSVTVDDFSTLLAVYRESLEQKKKVKIHLAFNTGMNRFGFNTVDDICKAIKFLKGKTGILLEGFYSHLSEPENDIELKKAVDKFLVAKKIVKSYNNKVTCHISASGGFVKGEYHDMVRIGIMLYGYYPFNSDCVVKVSPIMKIYAKVLKTRTLKKGDKVGYGKFRLKANKKISLIRFGYADGLFRKNRLAFINDRCMDVTAIGGTKARYHKVLFDAKKLAERYDTISYEILVRATARSKKIYIR